LTPARWQRKSTVMGNPVVRFEIGCRDSETTKAFFSALFDWRIEGAGPGLRIDTGAAVGGGITSLGHEPHQYTMFYVEVANIGATLAEVERLGGKKLVGPVPLPTGSFAWFSDPEGNTVGLWQPAK
jgi:uncharacterized protein